MIPSGLKIIFQRTELEKIAAYFSVRARSFERNSPLEGCFAKEKEK